MTRGPLAARTGGNSGGGQAATGRKRRSQDQAPGRGTAARKETNHGRDTQITIAGNLVDDPELRFTPSGQPVAKFRVASTPRFRDNATGEWKDGDSLFLTCNVWRQAAENVAESLTRGTRVIVTGRLKQRSYETKEGEKRTVYELEVDEVGPSLRNASAKVTKATRASRGGGQARPGREADPWASEGPAGTPTSRLSRRGRTKRPSWQRDAGAGASHA